MQFNFKFLFSVEGKKKILPISLPDVYKVDTHFKFLFPRTGMLKKFYQFPFPSLGSYFLTSLSIPN